MKKILFSLIAFIVCTTAMAQQRFMDDLRKEKVGQGKVIVYQSLVIDALVNGSANTKNGDSKPDNKTTNSTEENHSTTHNQPAVRANGYRIQIFAGGNSRQAREEAERKAAVARNNFPELGAYAHFNNPRWICRIGNFKTQAEANAMLPEVKALFPEAAVVRCQIILNH